MKPLPVDEQFLTYKRCAELTTLSEPELVRRVRVGRFPKPIRLGPRRVAFRLTEIRQWMADRIAEASRGEETDEEHAA